MERAAIGILSSSRTWNNVSPFLATLPKLRPQAQVFADFEKPLFTAHFQE
jgi:hypothetical protein